MPNGSAEEKRDNYLNNQLALLGQRIAVNELRDLRVPAAETHYISGVDPNMPGVKWLGPMGFKIKPKSWPELKKMIGIPDEIGRRLVTTSIGPAARVASSELLLENRIPRKKMLGAALSLGREYIMRDSSTLKAYEPFLEAVMKDISIVVPVLKDVIVEKDATLVLGSDVHKVVAGNVVIKTGGKIQSKSSYVMFNCFSMKGNQP